MNFTNEINNNVHTIPLEIYPACWGMAPEMEISIVENDEAYQIKYLEKVMPSIKWLAHNYSSDKCSLLNFDDLLQEGITAALLAMHNYDEARGTQLTTHMINMAKYSMREYCKKNAFIFTKGIPQKSYQAWRSCVEDGEEPTIENLMDRGLNYITAVATIDIFVRGGNIDVYDNHEDNGQYWELDKVERNAKPVDFFKYMTQAEADAVRKKFEYDEPIKTKFQSRKQEVYALDRAIIKIRSLPDVEQYLDLLHG